MTTQNQPNQSSQEPQGLPEIANSNPAKIRIYALCCFAVILLLMGWLLFSKSEKKYKKHPQDETFEVGGLAPDIGAKRSSKTPTSNQKIPDKPSNAQKLEPASDNQQAQLEEAQKLLKMRLEAPLMAVANASGNSSNSSPKKASNDANTQFLNEVSSQESQSVQATILSNLSTLIAEGRLIQATLEPAINTDLPGHLRAIVSFPVYSEDGSQILIPIFSRLLGQYKSMILQGQSRIFIVWTRVITPNGISIPLGSPGVDSLGAAGMEADRIDRHFWQMFGTASLLSLIGAGTSHIGVHSGDEPNSASSYRQAVAQSFSQSANHSLKQNAMPPTLNIQQGQIIYVYVAKDLRFDQAASHLNQFRIFD